MAASKKQIVAQAAARYGVPLYILWGVYGMETGWGGYEVSSAGAQGPFQFLPSTAAEYHVNTHDLASSADGAARYLHSLFKSSGSWDRALHGYSGGGYGLSEVAAKAKEGGVAPGDRATLPPGMPGAGKSTGLPAAAGSDGTLFNSDERSGALKALLWVAFVIGGFWIAGTGFARMFRSPEPAGGA